jgi:hypothetical protein
MRTAKTGLASRFMTVVGWIFGRRSASHALEAASEPLIPTYDPPAHTLRGPAFLAELPRHNFACQMTSVSRMNVPNGRKARTVSPTGSSIKERPMRNASPQKRQPAKRHVWLADRHIKPPSAKIIPLPLAAKAKVEARPNAPRARAA